LHPQHSQPEEDPTQAQWKQSAPHAQLVRLFPRSDSLVYSTGLTTLSGSKTTSHINREDSSSPRCRARDLIAGTAPSYFRHPH